MTKNSEWTEVQIEFDSWTIPSRYSNTMLLVEGTFGDVCSAQNTRSGERVAIKRLKNPFEHAELARRALREIKLLKHAKSEANNCVVQLVDLFSRADLPEKLEEM
jgi:serine/threonine protein kinase